MFIAYAQGSLSMAPMDENNLRSLEADRLLATEQDLQHRFGESVLPSSSSHGSTRKQLMADLSSASAKVKNHAIKKQSSLPKTKSDWYGILVSLVPVITTLRTYKKSYIAGDLSSGIAEGVMKVPQGMAYAILAKLPVEYGEFCTVQSYLHCVAVMLCALTVRTHLYSVHS
jgi:Sulfate permease family